MYNGIEKAGCSCYILMGCDYSGFGLRVDGRLKWDAVVEDVSSCRIY